MTEQLSAKLYNACLRAIRDMGVDEFKKSSWFGWKNAKADPAAPQIAITQKKAA